MNKIKSLADQLRDRMITAYPEEAVKETVPVSAKKRKAIASDVPEYPELIQQIIAYNSSYNKCMVHAKLDANTNQLLGRFKMATGVDHIKLVAFAVKHLFDTQPELKTYIKNYIQNLEL
jgi:hypothetical protein